MAENELRAPSPDKVKVSKIDIDLEKVKSDHQRELQRLQHEHERTQEMVATLSKLGMQVVTAFRGLGSATSLAFYLVFIFTACGMFLVSRQGELDAQLKLLGVISPVLTTFVGYAIGRATGQPSSTEGAKPVSGLPTDGQRSGSAEV